MWTSAIWKRRLKPVSKPVWKIAASLGIIELLLSLAPQPGLAQLHGAPGGGVHIGGGGMGHVGGGGMPHLGGGGMPHLGGGIPHFGGGALGGVTHFGGAGIAHFGSHAIGHLGGPGISHMHGPQGGHLGAVPPHGFPGILRTHVSGQVPGHVHIGRVGRFGHGPTTHHPIVGTAHNPRIISHVGEVTPGNFAERRRRLAAGGLYSFVGNRRWHGWYHHHHWGWFGPIFWPYAYGDFFYFALWPYDYADYDPFWYYGYDDIYEGIFWPYDYTGYVRGRRAAVRMRSLTHRVAQSCADEAAEVTGWPVEQIQAAVQPDPQQKTLLDALANAIVEASDVVKAHCPTAVSFTPTGRMADMQERLEGLVQAVNIVEPALAKFYDSLSDENKARFNAIAAPSGKKPTTAEQTRQAAQNPQAECGQNVMAFPTARIDEVVHPNAAQRPKLEALQAANVKAADVIKAACPSTVPATPPDRLAAEGKRLQALLTAVETIRPALDDFYGALSDEQKARFNNLGRQLFAQK